MNIKGIPVSGSRVCGLVELSIGAAKVVVFGTGARPFEMIVVRDESGVRGFVNECPHLPLPLNIGSRIYSVNEQLHCDHHYAVFRFSDGECTSGVCVGQALTSIALAVTGDDVTIE